MYTRRNGPGNRIRDIKRMKIMVSPEYGKNPEDPEAAGSQQ